MDLKMLGSAIGGLGLRACSRLASRSRSWETEVEEQARLVADCMRLRKRQADQKLKESRSKKRQRMCGVDVKCFKPQASSGAITLLEGIHPKEATRRDYLKRLTEFLEFAREWRLEVHTAQGLDAALADYVDLQYLRGEQGTGGTKLWAALRHARPELGRAAANRLPRFMRAVRTWSRVSPGQSREPLPSVVRSGIESALLSQGWWEEALFVALGFEGYFRFWRSSTSRRTMCWSRCHGWPPTSVSGPSSCAPRRRR